MIRERIRREGGLINRERSMDRAMKIKYHRIKVNNWKRVRVASRLLRYVICNLNIIPPRN